MKSESARPVTDSVKPIEIGIGDVLVFTGLVDVIVGVVEVVSITMFLEKPREPLLPGVGRVRVVLLPAASSNVEPPLSESEFVAW